MEMKVVTRRCTMTNWLQKCRFCGKVEETRENLYYHIMFEHSEEWEDYLGPVEEDYYSPDVPLYCGSTWRQPEETEE